MYERMLDKINPPERIDIEKHMGKLVYERMRTLIKRLEDRYDLIYELKFPFGDSYGWGYKFSHKSKHLCYVFFEQEAFTVTIQVGDKEAEKLKPILPDCLEQTKKYWKKRYPCEKRGGWIHYRVMEEIELEDVLKIVAVKRKPVK
ncbi:DUF3788 domain-containing protein [Lachnospiraceae bacterium ZAX-1]